MIAYIILVIRYLEIRSTHQNTVRKCTSILAVAPRRGREADGGDERSHRRPGPRAAGVRARRQGVREGARLLPTSRRRPQPEVSPTPNRSHHHHHHPHAVTPLLLLLLRQQEALVPAPGPLERDLRAFPLRLHFSSVTLQQLIRNTI